MAHGTAKDTLHGMQDGSRPRLAFIEGIRGVAALYVVLQHFCTLVDPQFVFMRPGYRDTFVGRLMAPFWYGHFAVAAFIVVSGFCLQWSLFSRGGDGRVRELGEFFKRRCRRILPPYYACLAVSLFVILQVPRELHNVLPWSQYLPVTTENLVAHLLMVHNLSRDWMYKINGVLWSISIEFQLYFLFPLIAAAAARWRNAWVLLGSAGAVISALVVLENAEKLYVWYFGLFVLGMVGARAAQNWRGVGMPVFWGLFLLAVSSVWWTKNLAVRDTLMGLAVVLLLIEGSGGKAGWLGRFLSVKPLLWLGTFSYSLYLVHHPVLLFTSEAIGMRGYESVATRLALCVAVCLPVIIVFSFGFFWLFERPFLSAKRRAG